MPQDKKLTNKDYIAGKGDYMDKYSGTIGQMDPDGEYYGFAVGGKRGARIDAAGRNAQREMNDSYAKNNRNGRGTSIGMLKQLSHSLSAHNNAEKVALAKGMKPDDAYVYGSNAAKNSRPNLNTVPAAKPVSAKTAAKMVGAMAGKQPVSPMRKLLKIK